jgi:hypothetical protein
MNILMTCISVIPADDQGTALVSLSGERNDKTHVPHPALTFPVEHGSEDVFVVGEKYTVALVKQ